MTALSSLVLLVLLAKAPPSTGGPVRYSVTLPKVASGVWSPNPWT